MGRRYAVGVMEFQASLFGFRREAVISDKQRYAFPEKMCGLGRLCEAFLIVNLAE